MHDTDLKSEVEKIVQEMDEGVYYIIIIIGKGVYILGYMKSIMVL